MTLCQAFVRVIFRLPAPTVPDHDRATAVLSLWNRTLKFVVGDRMVLDLNGEPLFTGNEARAPRDPPAFHYAVELKPKVVVEPPGGVLLYDESVATLACHGAFRFGRDAEPALCPIGLQP